jgi:methyltransferase (TIGR00027 family)
MVRTTPYTDSMAFAMVVRTSAIDRLVLSAIAKGVDTVINIGAGLDTRPYRMSLVSSLSWIEVDFESTIEYKNEKLLHDRPVCKLRRVGCDLSHDAERRALLTKLGAETRNALIITEGVIGYLTNEEAQKLSEDFYAVPSFQYWIMDYSQGRLRKNRMMKKLRKKLAHAPVRFSEKDPLEFFARQGWKVDEDILILDEADRIGRTAPLHFPLNVLMALFPRKVRGLGNKTYGYVMFGRQ